VFVWGRPTDTEEHPLLSQYMSAAARQDVRFLFDRCTDLSLTLDSTFLFKCI
jgi:hypothetical protein